MSATAAPRSLRFGPFDLLPATRTLLRDGSPTRLAGRAFDVLLVLVERRDRPVSKADLLAAVWPGTVVEDNTLQVHVSRLRTVLGAAAISTVQGRGYRFTAELDADADADPRAPSHATATATATAAAGSVPAAVPHNLPLQSTRFIGRDAALLQGARLLEKSRLLTLTGMGGCGKTRLALQLAQRQLSNFSDGVWFVDLATLAARVEPQRVAAALAAALGLAQEAGTLPLWQRLHAHLLPRRVLLLLDNCEHVIDAAAELAQALLSTCAGVTILATSRESLGVAGEQVVPVCPMALPQADDRVAALDSEAARLFVDRARLARPDFQADARHADDIVAICRQLDGIALAIELAAARVGMLSVAEINARLADRFRFLRGNHRAAARQQTLQDTLDWSYEALPAVEQRLFGQLSVFAGGCTLEAATAVADIADSDEIADRDEHAVLALLTRLHAKSLLMVENLDAKTPRFRLIETVRQYAQARLDAAAMTDMGEIARDRHLRSFVALAEQAADGLQGPQQGLWMARLATEQDNLLVAHGRCAQAAGGTLAGLRLSACLWRYWVASAQLGLGFALVRAALAQADETLDANVNASANVDALWHARAVWAAGQISFRMGRYAESLALADRCLALAVAAGDAEQIAAGMGLRAKGLHSTGDHGQALLQYEQACAVARTLPTPLWLGTTLNNLAELHRGAGRVAAAQRCYEEAIDISRASQSPDGTFVPLCNLARLSVNSGRLDRARTLLLESLQLATGAGLKGMDEDVLEVAAGLASQLRQFDSAARFAGAALARMNEGGSRREPVDEAFIAPLIARAKSVLGPRAFSTAESLGSKLSHEAAVGEVRRWLEQAG